MKPNNSVYNVWSDGTFQYDWVEAVGVYMKDYLEGLGVAGLDSENLALAGALLLGVAQNDSNIINYVDYVLRTSRVENGIPLTTRAEYERFAIERNPQGKFAFVEKLLKDLVERRRAERFVFSTQYVDYKNSSARNYRLSVNHPDFNPLLDKSTDGETIFIALPVNDASLITNKEWDSIEGGLVEEYPIALARSPIGS